MKRMNNDAVSPVIAVILMVAITVVLAAVLYVMVGGLLTEQSALVTGDGLKQDVTNTTAGIDIVVIGGGDKAIAEFSAYLIAGNSAVVSMPAVSTTDAVTGGVTMSFNDLNGDGFLTGIDSFTFTGLTVDTDYTFTLEYSGQEVFSEDFTTLAA